MNGMGVPSQNRECAGRQDRRWDSGRSRRREASTRSRNECAGISKPSPRRERDSAERNISRVDDLERAVALAQAKRAVRLEPFEAAADRVASAAMDRQLTAERVRACEPCLGEKRRFAVAPQAHETFEATCKKRGKCLRS